MRSFSSHSFRTTIAWTTSSPKKSHATTTILRLDRFPKDNESGTKRIGEVNAAFSKVIASRKQRKRVQYWSGSGSDYGDVSQSGTGGSFDVDDSFDADGLAYDEFVNREDFEKIEWHAKPLNLRAKDLLKQADDNGFWIIFTTVGVGVVAYLESCETDRKSVV